MGNNKITRKEALKRMGFFLVSPILYKPLTHNPFLNSAQVQGWEELPNILKNIVPPKFQNRDFLITKYGAKAGGTKDCLPAIKEAIAKCSRVGGGRVVVPSGTWFVKGPIQMENNVNLHLRHGATIKFSTDADDYLPVVLTRFEGMELMNYSPLVYAYGKENIALTGAGTLDGGANNNHWWKWTGNRRFGWKEGEPAQHDQGNEPELVEMVSQGVPVKDRIFGKGHYLRPTFVEFYRSKNILIQGVTIKNSPFWILHPTLSQNVTIDGVKTISPGPNNDGCDPESCTDVLIKSCYFSNGDDCIAIKSGRNQDGRRVGIPSKNIIVEDCHMRDGHAGVAIGSETSGGIENVYVRDCVMNSPHLERAIRIKSNACRGGVLKNFYYRNIEVGTVHEAVVKINMLYGNESGKGCHFPPMLSNVNIDHVVSHKSEYAIYIQGRQDKAVRDITIKNCKFNNVEKVDYVEYTKDMDIEHTTVNGKEIKG